MLRILHVFKTNAGIRYWLRDTATQNPTATIYLATSQLILDSVIHHCVLLDKEFVVRLRGLVIQDYVLHEGINSLMTVEILGEIRSRKR